MEVETHLLGFSEIRFFMSGVVLDPARDGYLRTFFGVGVCRLT